MLKEIKRLSLDSLVYGIGQVATRLLGFFLIPLYTRFLTTDDYGVLAVLLVLPQLLGDISNLGILSAFSRFYFDGEVGDRKDVIATTFIFNLGSSVVFFYALSLISNSISRLMIGSSDQGFLLNILFAYLIARNQIEFVMAIYRVERKPGLYSLITIIRVLINFGMTIVLVSRFRMGVLGVLLGQIIPEVLLLPFLLVLVVGPRFKLRFSGRLLRKMVAFGLPLTPVTITAWIVNSMPVTLLARLSSLSESGLFSMGYKFGALILSFVVAPFQLGWSPIAYEKADSESAPALYSRVFTYLAAVLSFSVTGMALVSGDLIRLMATPEFYLAEDVVLAVAIGAMAFGLYVFFAVLINIARKTYLSTLIWSASAGMSLALGFLMIPKYGRFGAAWSYAAAYLLVAVTGFIAAQKVFPLQYEWNRLVRIFAAGFFCLVIGRAVSVESVIPDLLLHTGIVFSMPVVLVLSGFLLESEKRLIGSAIQSIMKKREV
ncbi:MAG: oligosaccharide flippase family protein [Anaerolineales bacterium]|nr:oligosaccharide flippase family protein [Anaerolineales bacterium]